MIYILISILSYTSAIMLISFASRIINSNLVTAIVHFISAILPVLIIIPILNKNPFNDSKLGMAAAILGGIAIAVFGLSLNKSFTVNKVGIVTPIVYGGTILLTTVLGSIIFKEKVSMLQSIGLAIMGVGLAIIIYVKSTGN